MEKINQKRDPETGRFLTTTDTTRYKMVQFNNQRMSEYAREICISLNIPKIPKGFVIHHLDENKRNNHIDNLALMTVTAHNRIHSHEPWNKGIKANNSKKWKEAIIKAQISRDKHYFTIFNEYYNLYNNGVSVIEIGKKFNKNRNTIYSGIKKYKILSEKYGRIN